MNRTRTQHIHIRPQPTHQAILHNPPARLYQELSLAPPLVLELLCRTVQLVPDEVVEHDDIGAGRNGLVGFGLVLALDIDEEGEACYLAGPLDGLGDGALMVSLACTLGGGLSGRAAVLPVSISDSGALCSPESHLLLVGRSQPRSAGTPQLAADHVRIREAENLPVAQI
jgi:hypothetical protein